MNWIILRRVEDSDLSASSTLSGLAHLQAFIVHDLNNRSDAFPTQFWGRDSCK
jgi:hypothetical protein